MLAESFARVVPAYQTSEEGLKQKIGVSDFQNIYIEESKRVVNYLDKAPKEEAILLAKLMSKKSAYSKYVVDKSAVTTKGGNTAFATTNTAAEDKLPGEFHPDWTGYDPYVTANYSGLYLPAYHEWTVCTNSFGFYRIMSRESISLNDYGLKVHRFDWRLKVGCSG